MTFEGWSKFFVVLGTCLVVAGGLVSFHKHCQRRFQYPIFSAKLLLRLAFGILCLAAGGWTFGKQQSGLEGLGAVFFTIGGIVLWWSLSQNFIRTNLLHGLAATVLQLLLVGIFGPAVALVGMSLGGVLVVLFSAIVPVYVVNRRSRA